MSVEERMGDREHINLSTGLDVVVCDGLRPSCVVCGSVCNLFRARRQETRSCALEGEQRDL